MATYDRRTFLKRSAIWTAAAAAAGGAFVPRGAGAATRQAAQHPFFAAAKNRPEVIAHRGGDLQWPGETMFAFEQAVKLGVDMLEMDVYQTSDGELVLMHDADVRGTTDGRGLINRMTLAELKRLNAAYRWKDENGQFKHRDDNLRVATLAEVFDAFPGVRMNIEMKPALRSPVSKLCALIRAKKMSDRVLVASFRHSYLEDFRVHCPGVATSASTWELGQYLFRRRPLKAQAIQLKPEIEAEVLRRRLFSKKILTKEFVETARTKFNLQVHAWTVNEEKKMREAIAAGVDGIITDHPSRLLSVLGRAAQASGRFRSDVHI